MLPSSPALLVAVLPFVNLVLAQTLTFSWPSNPETSIYFSLKWSGGTPPYTVYVFKPGLEEYYYKDVGSDLSTSYNFPLSAGTEVVFQCRDSYKRVATSPTVTVLETLYLRYPWQPEIGFSFIIQWGGGLPPYTVYVLTTDQGKQYWKYTGSETNQNWTPNMDPDTQVVFQVLDSNGINATSDPVTVHGNAASSNEPILSALSTMSVASVNSIASVASISSLSVLSTSTHESTTTSVTPSESTTTLTSSTYHYPGDTYTASKSTTTFTTPTASNTSGTNGGKGPNVVAIVAGVVGGVVGLTLGGALFFLPKQGSAGHRNGAQMEMSDNDYVSRRQEGNPIGQPTSPTVDPFGDAPNAGVIVAGAGDADIGGAGVSGNSFTPGRQLHGPGGIYLGAHTGAADHVGRARGPSSNGTQQPFPPHAVAASTGGGSHSPSQINTSDSDSGYGPGSSLFHEHQ